MCLIPFVGILIHTKVIFLGTQIYKNNKYTSISNVENGIYK